MGRVRRGAAPRRSAAGTQGAGKSGTSQALIAQALEHQRRGQLDRAEAAYRAVVAQSPDATEALANLGGLLLTQGRYDEAERNFQAALENQPDHPGLHVNMGNLRRTRGDLEGAENSFRQAIALAPDYAGAHLNLGAVLRLNGALDDAARALHRAIELAPDNALGHLNLGNLLRDMGRLDAAIERYREAARLRPDYLEAHLSLGNALHVASQFAAAEATQRQALALCADDARCHTNLGNTLRAQGRIDEALAHYERALALNPDCPETPLARAVAWLLASDFGRGWPAYEGRWIEKAQRGAFREFDAPHWNGEPLSGKQILVYGEQGPGDIVMFASCLPELIERAGQVHLQCRGSTAALLARSFPAAAVATDRIPESGAWRPPPAADYVVAIGSLPRFFRTDAQSFARGPARYLAPDAPAVARWRQRIAALGPGLKVGISWRGGATASEHSLRVMSLADWEPLLQTPGVHFVNLQYGDCRAELAALRETSEIEIHDWDDADPVKDLDGFAAQIEALDLVISVANTTIHFAGALGKPVWNLVPTAPSWRWQLSGSRCLWYPSVRMIRQRPDEPWRRVIEGLSAQFTERVAERDGAVPDDASPSLRPDWPSQAAHIGLTGP